MQPQTNIDRFHTYLNTVLSELLENQIRTRAFITGIQQYKNQIAEAEPTQPSNDNQHDREALTQSNALLIKLGAIGWEQSIDQIKQLLVKCNYLVRELHKATIDRELYEHQSHVLKGIILSHDKIKNWEEFVQSILLEFHSIFAFDFFSIAFDTDEGIDLYLYYMGKFPARALEEAKEKLLTPLMSTLSKTKALTIKEYQVLDEQLVNVDLGQMHSVTIDVDEKQENLGGLLEMGYFSSVPLGIDEKSIIRSILSVMVMVIGSSRTLKKTLTELDFHAKQDALTGLYNRRYFNEFLESEIERCKRHSHVFSLLMLDLDNFKGINDSYGHLYGDNVLQAIAQILKNKIRRGDIISRLGGDEFTIILPETNIAGASHLAEQIIKTIEAHQFSDEYNFHITSSIGLVSYPTHATSALELLSHADIALYQAKAKGRNTVCIYDPRAIAVKNPKQPFYFTQNLARAIREERIIAYFQPIVTTDGKSIFAYEALARLVSESGEIISASQFLDATERSDINTEIDKCIIQYVTCTLLNDFDKVEDYPLVFINLSTVSLQNWDILQYAAGICKEKGIPANRIVFEITEREAVRNISGMKQFLVELRRLGFAFALDNFGSGYNSFHYLRELYFEYVKINGEFVKNMLGNKADNALIESLYSLSEKLGMNTIAEHVESNAILLRLQEVGVSYCQGFHTGLPDATIGHC